MKKSARTDGLAQRVKDALGGKPSHGTVVRWQTSAGYTYMAMAVETRPGSLRWYSTATAGNPYVPESMTSARLLAVLGSPEVTSIGVTDDFEEVAPSTPLTRHTKECAYSGLPIEQRPPMEGGEGDLCICHD